MYRLFYKGQLKDIHCDWFVLHSKMWKNIKHFNWKPDDCEIV